MSKPILLGRDIDFDDTHRLVAIVGSREASDRERYAAYELGKALSSIGITVVSGLARGIDEEAHKGALAASGSHCKTLAILSTSPKEKIYPPENNNLANAIKEQGAILYPYDTEAPWTKDRFGPKQKRLAERSVMQAVVSSAVYVVSDYDYIEGGTRWALNYATYLNRKVFRYSSRGNVYDEVQFKEEKRLIPWQMELDWRQSYEDLLSGNYKHIRPATW